MTVISSNTGKIIARAGGTQLLATAITKPFTIVVTVASAGDSVRLPPMSAGDVYEILSKGANSCNIFPPVTNNFLGKATNAPLALLPNNRVTVRCYEGENGILRFN